MWPHDGDAGQGLMEAIQAVVRVGRWGTEVAAETEIWSQQLEIAAQVSEVVMGRGGRGGET